MKHAAEIISNPPIYCREETTPNGAYHWAKSINRKPPLLTKITQIRWYEAEWSYFNGERRRIVRGEPVTIWKRGWHHVKGARKKVKK